MHAGLDLFTTCAVLLCSSLVIIAIQDDVADTTALPRNHTPAIVTITLHGAAWVFSMPCTYLLASLALVWLQHAVIRMML